MGSYGIGPARLMGTIVEVLSDEKGIVWPEAVAPFRYHIVSLAPDDAEVNKLADDLYESFINKGIETLYDDRVGVTPGEKFNDSDLYGIPTRIVVSKKTLGQSTFEVKERKDRPWRRSKEWLGRRKRRRRRGEGTDSLTKWLND